MSELHIPSPAIAPSNGQAVIGGSISTPAIRGGTDGGFGQVSWPTRYKPSLAA